MKAFGLIIFVVLLALISTVLSGYVLSVMWQWFMVPLFSVPALSVPYAIGLSMIVRFCTYEYKEATWTKGKDAIELVSTMVTVTLFPPLFALAAAWVVTLFL